ncbi:hypothetical protein FisN_1Hh567 [Fistulifera solaris]|uniref:Uncharacterized protein n=1 Tax=Fistulifera solaris TaxID=1519565 RepID=A0A1Z5KRB2_FISSO|nr:hypothetical protein FisN_1Hh567 [Fistulifera solaris]|eukprot:GAX28642.1 hypothetical protein FisN_1Hh567 [Fistulifera solaris]
MDKRQYQFDTSGRLSAEDSLLLQDSRETMAWKASTNNDDETPVGGRSRSGSIQSQTTPAGKDVTENLKSIQLPKKIEW